MATYNGKKNDIHYVAIVDILTELFQKYSLNGLLSALCFFLHPAHFDR